MSPIIITIMWGEGVTLAVACSLSMMCGCRWSSRWQFWPVKLINNLLMVFAVRRCWTSSFKALPARPSHRRSPQRRNTVNKHVKRCVLFACNLLCCRYKTCLYEVCTDGLVEKRKNESLARNIGLTFLHFGRCAPLVEFYVHPTSVAEKMCCGSVTFRFSFHPPLLCIL